MEMISTEFPGLFLVKPNLFRDDRGYFFEKYHAGRYREHGIDVRFVQDNQSRSSRFVLRGLHYQLAPWGQSKLVHVPEGEILDVVVDLRKNAPTYGRWFSTRLSAENMTLLFVPRGFAHGFVVLSESAIVEYKCDNYYRPEAERGILYSDPDLGIDWEIDLRDAVISPKDRLLPPLAKAEVNFIYGEQ